MRAAKLLSALDQKKKKNCSVPERWISGDQKNYKIQTSLQLSPTEEQNPCPETRAIKKKLDSQLYTDNKLINSK